MIRIGSFIQKNWDWRAASNFMFGGTGSGLLLLLVIATYPKAPPLPVELVALAFVASGLSLVWLEIGRPWRAINVFFHPETSWMTREAFVAGATFVLALAGIVLQMPVLVAASAVGAAGFLYCQGRILKASKGIPAWREPAVVPLIIATGLTEGAAGLLLLMALVGGATPAWLEYVLLGMLAVRVITWSRYRAALVASNAPPAALAALEKISGVTLWLGNVLPAALIALPFVMPNLGSQVALVGGLLALLSGWYMKFTIVTKAAQVQGYSFGKLTKGHPLANKAR